MEMDNVFKNEGNKLPPAWISSDIGMELLANELNYTSERLPNCFFNPNWENSADQTNQFESALSSMVSSPATSSAGIPGTNGDNVELRELIGRLGSICSSGEISPQSYVGGSTSTNASCYSTPLNSPPKLGMSMMDHQIRRHLSIPGNQLPTHPTLAPFSSDPGFAERAARFSSFGSTIFGLNGQFGLHESDLPHRLATRADIGKHSRVSSNQSVKFSECPTVGQENIDGFLKDGMSASDKNFSRLSRPLTPENAENGDSREGSSISERIQGGEIGIKSRNDSNSRKRKLIPRGRAKEVPPSPFATDTKVVGENTESITKRSKPDEVNEKDKDTSKGNAEVNGSGKTTSEGNQKQKMDNPKPPEPLKDYIHVRARRGQATDSHSLAERVRREKISQRMKFLQDLVPGCSKVTGKAVMLDEIINYVQSLQRQVEFLSMKLATVNPRMDLNMEALLSKDIIQSRASFTYSMYNVDDLVQTFPYAFQSQQGTNLHNAVPRTETTFSINPLNGRVHRNPSMQLPPIDGLGEAASQASIFWEGDLQSIVQMSIGQNEPQSFHGTVAATQMKVEL